MALRDCSIYRLNFLVNSSLFCGERFPISHIHLSFCHLHIGFVYELHSLLFKRQRMLPLCISDTEQPGFFQRKQQERKSGKGNGIKEEPSGPLLMEENLTFMSEKGESRRSWKEQVSQEKKGNTSIKTEVANNQTANFPSFVLFFFLSLAS